MGHAVSLAFPLYSRSAILAILRFSCCDDVVPSGCSSVAPLCFSSLSKNLYRASVYVRLFPRFLLNFCTRRRQSSKMPAQPLPLGKHPWLLRPCYALPFISSNNHQRPMPSTNSLLFLESREGPHYAVKFPGRPISKRPLSGTSTTAHMGT